MSGAYEDLILAEVALWPGASAEFGRRAKHRQVTLSYGGATRFVVYPDSGSDWRGALNNIRDVRKELTALGAERIERKSVERRRPKQRRSAPRQGWTARIDPAPVKPNPFDALAGFVPAPPPKQEDSPMRFHPRTMERNAIIVIGVVLGGLGFWALFGG